MIKIREWTVTIVVALLISLTVRTYVAEAMVVPTGSMLPTIQINDRVVVEKLPWSTDYEFGDIVVFYPPVPDAAHERYVKRLIGLPGDTIQITNSTLIRNGVPVEEPYLLEKMRYSFGPITVPSDHYFFLGDNRNNSRDSHLWPQPFVARDQLVGKVLVTLPTHLVDKQERDR